MSKDTTITQIQLQLFLESKAQLEQAEKKVAALRRDLLEKLEADAVVESGPLSADVRVVTQRPLTAEKLIPLLGKERVEELKAQVAPTLQRQVIVQPRPTAVHQPVAVTNRPRDDEFEG